MKDPKKKSNKSKKKNKQKNKNNKSKVTQNNNESVLNLATTTSTIGVLNTPFKIINRFIKHSGTVLPILVGCTKNKDSDAGHFVTVAATNRVFALIYQEDPSAEMNSDNTTHGTLSLSTVHAIAGMQSPQTKDTPVTFGDVPGSTTIKYENTTSTFQDNVTDLYTEHCSNLCSMCDTSGEVQKGIDSAPVIKFAGDKIQALRTDLAKSVSEFGRKASLPLHIQATKKKLVLTLKDEDKSTELKYKLEAKSKFVGIVDVKILLPMLNYFGKDEEVILTCNGTSLLKVHTETNKIHFLISTMAPANN